MLKRIALIDYNHNNPAEIVKARNTLVPKIVDFLVKLGMPRNDIIVRVQKFDGQPNLGLEPGWRNYQSVTRTRDTRKNELIGLVCYKTEFPVALRQFIFSKNYGMWANPESQVKSDNPKDATSGILAQSCTGAFIDLTIKNWDRLLHDYHG